MATKKTKPIVEEVKEEIVAPVEEVKKEVKEEVIAPVEETNTKKFVVVTTDRLNVRKGPSKDTEVLNIVSKDEKLLINDPKLVKGFYSITTSSGIKGYVMKEFVVEK
jgi:uncharacterized protein YgiM (DUF1202 family)